MKSLNIKKIATVAAGAALLGTAFAGAAVTVDEGLGNYVPTLFSNGEPNVQVVLGSAALPSDGIAAANIAAALGSKTFASTTVASTATSDAASTTAPVVFNVSRPVTATAANEYLCTTGLEDNLDNNGCGIGSSALNKSTSKASRTGSLPNTFKEITDSDWAVLGPSRTITVSGSVTQTSTERQSLNCFALTTFNDQLDAYVSDQMECLWRATFSSPLPVCSSTSTAFSACDSSDKLDSTSAPTTVYFLGDPWIVTGLTIGGSTSQYVDTFSVGRSYTVRQTIAVGSELAVGETGFTVSLTDVYAPSGSTSQPSCGLLITAPDGRTVTKNRDKNSASIKISELGNIWVKVGAVGYSAVAGATNTCEVSSFSDAITLRNGTIDESLYPNWKAIVDSNNRSSTQGISELRVYNDNYAFPSGTRATPGNKFTIISGLTSNTGFEIEFVGADITATDRDALSISEYDLSANLPGGQGTGTSLSIHALRFVSTKSDAFRFGSTNVNTVYYLAKNKTSASQNLTGSWFYTNSSGDWINATDVIHTDGNGVIYTGSPQYYYATGGGADTNVRFNVSINSGNRNTSNTFSIGNATHLNVSVPEVLNESTSTTAAYWYMYYDYGTIGATDGNFRSALGGTTNDNINYTSAAFGVGFNGNMPFYSPRGSFVSSYSSTGLTINYATRLGKAVYKIRQLLGTGSGATPTVTCATFPCDLGSGVTVSSRPSGVAATEVESVQAVNPNFGSRPLVVLDSAASASQPQIVVGGPWVNSVSASMEQCATLADAAAGDALVAVEGNKLCVAGFTAADTQAAARELISFLASWDPTAAAASE